MRLNTFETYKKIYIQCHDNPDADALASGFGLYQYFRHKNIEAALIYSGPFRIQKSNLLLMIKELEIPVEYIESGGFPPLGPEELLITTDCQYGAGNVTKLPAQHIAVIDHHQLEIDKIPYMFMDSTCGSCSTIVWRLLKQEDYPVNQDENLATALYYGLYTDTGQLSEIYNPYDKDMRDELQFDKTAVTRLRNANFSLDELEIAGIALIRHIYNDANRYAVLRAKPCDPNILGLISDLMLQVDMVDTCVVYSELTTGIKLSVRSCIKEVRADELARFLTKGIGSGGGHLEKAGGFISMGRYDEHYQTVSPETYFSGKMDDYFSSFDIFYAENGPADITGMSKYKKYKTPVGFVKTSSFLPDRTPALIRTFDGDIETTASDDTYIIIGLLGDAYPVSRKKFEQSYETTGEAYEIHVTYNPTIKNQQTGENHSLLQYAKICIPVLEPVVYARPLKKSAKVFTLWDADKYLLGNPGDYLVVRSENLSDIYVIDKDVFEKTYTAIP